jgi:hypothetical protein
MNVNYMYKKPDGTLGQLLDDSEEAVNSIAENIEFIKANYNTERVLAVLEGVKND